MDLTVPSDKAVAGHYDGYFRLGFARGETIHFANHAGCPR